MKILCVCHNTPYPPNKGDKIRAYHFLRSLAKEHELHLVSLAKDPTDVQYQEVLEEWCESVSIIPVHPLLSKVYALLCVLFRLPLSLGFFYSRTLQKRVNALAQSHSFDATLSFCSSVAHYTDAVSAGIRVVDFIDIDSEKWRQYAEVHSFPKNWIYAYEAKALEKTERKIHKQTTCSVVTTHVEKQRLEALAGCDGSRITVVPTGVSTQFYSRALESEVENRLVFTGQMDYLPNVDAVIHFHDTILPLIRREIPSVEFYIVGRNPSPELRAHCANAVVTGEVEDIREFLHSASVVVAPLRLAFGIQCKILEAMASCLPVVASDRASQGLEQGHGDALSVARSIEEFSEAVVTLCRDSEQRRLMAKRGREFVEEFYDWELVDEQFRSIFEYGENPEAQEASGVVTTVLTADGCERAL